MDLRATLGKWTVSPLRWHFFAVFVLSLSFGLALYLTPTFGSRIWPYAVKPLATQFFASVFLAVAFASFLALREPELRPATVLLVMGASVFATIIAAAIIDVSRFTAHIVAVIAWFALLTALVVGTGYVLVRGRGGSAPAGPGSAMPKWLRRHFLLHSAIVLFFSAQMLVGPNIAKSFWPWTVSDPVMRGIGGLFTGVAIGTAFAYVQKSWDHVRLLLPVNIVFVTLVLLAVGLNWSVITTESPGWHVTIPWLLLYIYTAAYPAYYIIRRPTNARGLSIPAGTGST